VTSGETTTSNTESECRLWNVKEFVGWICRIAKSDYQLSHVLPFVLMGKGSHRTNFLEVSVLTIFQKYVEKIQFYKNLTQTRGNLYLEQCIFVIILR
jgi:hypothetical protein